MTRLMYKLLFVLQRHKFLIMVSSCLVALLYADCGDGSGDTGAGVVCVLDGTARAK